MENLLGIIGSPRKMGNCELMVKEIAAAVRGPRSSGWFASSRRRSVPARRATGACPAIVPHQDDFAGVLRAIMEADAVIVAAPAYLRGTHSCLQRFLDRGLQAYRHVDALFGKPAVAVATAASRTAKGRR